MTITLPYVSRWYVTLTALLLKIDSTRVEAERLVTSVNGHTDWSFLVDCHDEGGYIAGRRVVELGDGCTTAALIGQTVAVLWWSRGWVGG